MPGPAHHGHVVLELPLRRPHLEPHVRLPHEIPVVPADPVRLAQRPHRLLQRGERRERVPLPHTPVLDDVLPPALGIVVPRGLGEDGEGIDADVRPGESDEGSSDGVSAAGSGGSSSPVNSPSASSAR
jgi:hypothetical protein